MLCPGLRLAAYLAVQAKHPATQEVGSAQTKDLNWIFSFQTNESNILQSHPADKWGSQYVLNLERQFKWKNTPVCCNIRFSIESEKDKGISPMVSKGVDHQYQRRAKEVSPNYCPMDTNIRFSIGRQAEWKRQRYLSLDYCPVDGDIRFRLAGAADAGLLWLPVQAGDGRWKTTYYGKSW